KQDRAFTGVFLLTRPRRTSDPVRSLHLPISPVRARLISLPQAFPLFAGINSKTGFVIQSTMSPVVFTQAEMPVITTVPELKEVQATFVFPLQRRGKIGGSFLVCSQRSSASLLALEELLSNYGMLLSLALDDGDFYDPNQIMLGAFSSLEEQLKREKDFPFA